MSSNGAGRAERGFAELGARALSYVGEISRVQDNSLLASALKEVIKPLGLETMACGAVSGAKVASGDPFYFLDWPKDWQALYEEEGFIAVDPMPRWARVSLQSRSMGELHAALPARDPGRRIAEAGRGYQLGDGMVIPVRVADGSRAVLCVVGDRDGFSPAERAFLEVIAAATVHRAAAIDAAEAAPKLDPLLSRRELDCIALLVRGLSDRDMAAMLQITVPTVRFHLEKARNKTGAVSRTHLAALAVWLGLARM